MLTYQCVEIWGRSETTDLKDETVWQIGGDFITDMVNFIVSVQNTATCEVKKDIV